jgi:hypothetical protein
MFFYRLLKETVLPQNLWVRTEPAEDGSPQIRSIGLRLGKRTWARIGLFPGKWHLHVFKSEPIAGENRPQEDLPLQAISLRLWGPDRLEIVDGRGRVRNRLKTAEELDLIPYCEWVAGESRRENQLTQRALKNL